MPTQTLIHLGTVVLAYLLSFLVVQQLPLQGNAQRIGQVFLGFLAILSILRIVGQI